MSVIPGQTISYIIGAGGPGGTSGNYDASGGKGANGTASYFGSLIFANGGIGGNGAIVGGGGGQGGVAGGNGGTPGTDGADFEGERNYGGNGGTAMFGNGTIWTRWYR